MPSGKRIKPLPRAPSESPAGTSNRTPIGLPSAGSPGAALPKLGHSVTYVPFEDTLGGATRRPSREAGDADSVATAHPGADEHVNPELRATPPATPQAPANAAGSLIRGRSESFGASARHRLNSGSMTFDLSLCAGETQVVTINCGGTNFQTFLKTLRRIPKTKLAQLSAEGGHLRKTGFVFFDRNPVAFAAVLEYYRLCRNCRHLACVLLEKSWEGGQAGMGGARVVCW
jgi:hypothetical protein